MLMNLAGSIQEDAVYLEAARLCKEGNGKSSSRALFKSYHLAPLSNAARERCRNAAVKLAFAETLCLV
jgi:hypothetical protein